MSTVDLRVTGAKELTALARRLHEAADTGLTREFRKALSKGGKPLEAAIRANVGEYLPSRYARIIAKAAKVTSRFSTRAREVSVRYVVTAKGVKTDRKIRTIDTGVLRHPVFARGPRSRWRWVGQSVRPGVVSDHVDRLRTQIRRDLVQAVHDTAKKITKEHA
jgi:hypothetical protein